MPPTMICSLCLLQHELAVRVRPQVLAGLRGALRALSPRQQMRNLRIPGRGICSLAALCVPRLML